MDERAASRRAEVAAQHTGSRGTAPPAWVAWSLSGVGFALVGAALVLVVLGSRPGGADAENFSQGVATTVAFALVGGLVASRRPSNPLGWLFLGIGLSGALGVLTERYAAYALVVEPGSLPGAVPVAWLGAFAWFPAFGLVPLALLLFSDGRLPGRRWRAAAWAATGGLVVCSVCLALIFLGDPVASVTAEGANPSPPPAVLAAAALGVAALGASGVAAVAAVVLRWRRSGGDQRQQLKCLVLAAATFLGSTLFGVVAANWLDVPGAGLAGLVGSVAVPVGAAVAILRYRLYDLDRVINRTIVYGLLTALLAAVYAAGAVLVPRLLGLDESQLAVAASTLAVAALFQPARRRVQAAVDRRFDRRRYDAARTVAAFSARLRDEVDLATLTGELLRVVDRTVQPAAVSLWLRPGTSPAVTGTVTMPERWDGTTALEEVP
jgi:hypothetical protein